MGARLGEMLLQAGLVREDQVEMALGQQRRFGGRIGSILLSLGAVDERTLALFLSRQLGVPFLVLSRSSFPLEVLSSVPLEVARRCHALPFHRDGRSLFVALVEPRAIGALDELRFAAGLRLVEHGALAAPLHDALEDAYRSAAVDSHGTWQGVEVDSSVGPGEAHLEIVVGRDALLPTAPAPAAEAPVPPPDTEFTAPSPATVFAAPPPPATLPLDDAAGWVDDLSATSPRPVPTGGDQGATILLVDDEPEVRRLLAQYLEKCGYQVRQAADGNAALAMLQQELPDALVLDAMLPGVHGFDICHRVKSSEATRHLPVIMVSAIYRGWRTGDDVRRLYGADVFLEKPLRLDELRAVLEAALAGRKTAAPVAELTARAQTALHAAADAYRNGDLLGAGHHLQLAIEAAPFVASLHHRLGVLYEKLGEPYRAIAALERAVELDPSYPHVLAVARLYEKIGFAYKAFEAWERCLRICPDPAEQETIRAHLQQLMP